VAALSSGVSMAMVNYGAHLALCFQSAQKYPEFRLPASAEIGHGFIRVELLKLLALKLPPEQ